MQGNNDLFRIKNIFLINILNFSLNKSNDS